MKSSNFDFKKTDKIFKVSKVGKIEETLGFYNNVEKATRAIEDNMTLGRYSTDRLLVIDYRIEEIQLA